MNLILILALTFVWLAILAGFWLGWQLLRQNGRLLLRLEALEKRLDDLEFGEEDAPEGLAVGSGAPAFELPDLVDGRRSLADLRGQSLLLIFFNPACGFCRDMAPKLAALEPRSSRREEAQTSGSEARVQQTELDQSLPTSAATNGLPLVLILTTGDTEQNRQFFREHKVTCPVLLQKDSEVATAYKANGTPAGYLISAEGKITSELAMGADALLALAAQPRSSRREEALTEKSEIRNPKSEMDVSLVPSAATSRFNNRSLARSKIKRDGLKAGTPAPDFRLPRLDGRGDLSLGDLCGRRVLLVFSSPGCGPCNTLARELEKFHRQHPELDVVIISKGEPKENRAKVKEHGLTFPVVLQQQWEISRRYAMFATPIAYLIDEAGVIAHDVAVGSDAILNLMARAERLGDETQEIVESNSTRSWS